MSLIVDDVKLAVIQQILNERMWHFRGGQNDPPTYFHGEEKPRIYATCMLSVFFV